MPTGYCLLVFFIDCLSLLHAVPESQQNIGDVADLENLQRKFFGVGNTGSFNHSTMKPVVQPETLFFDVDSFVVDLLNATKKNIIYKINDQLNRLVRVLLS